jgi:hypothetical protein
MSVLQNQANDPSTPRGTDGSEFLLVAVDDFDVEIARTRQNKKLMTLLEERARQPATVSLDEVKRQLSLQ